MRITAAEVVRFAAGGPPVIATTSAAASPLDRHRVQLLDTSGTVLYDEVLANPVRLLVARQPGGPDRLFLESHHLRALTLR